MSFAILYPYIKFIHLFFVMMWAMSAVGAYIFYLRSTIYELEGNPDDESLQERLIWAYEQFDKTVILEHVAFPIVLFTGALMFFGSGWSLANQWLLVKLTIVILVFIPMEVIDIWISHVVGPRISKRRVEEPVKWDLGRAMHLKFLRVTSPIVRLTVPAVVFLAIVKPILW